MYWSDAEVKAIIPRATWWVNRQYGIDLDRAGELVVEQLAKIYFNPPPSHVTFAACLFQRLAFAAKEYYRSEARLRWTDLPDDKWALFETDDLSCEDTLLAGELEAENLVCVKVLQHRLSHRDFHILWLYYMEDLRCPEIALRLDRSEVAVRQALKRARDRARVAIH
ncbi:MAG: sigma-70 family RNA polymerase sigma factor [Ardenticatenia bacterium]|nr:sigma-70 family RNA polymerase sigma factor [Ardenticatenia bacterium]